MNQYFYVLPHLCVIQRFDDERYTIIIHNTVWFEDLFSSQTNFTILLIAFDSYELEIFKLSKHYAAPLSF